VARERKYRSTTEKARAVGIALVSGVTEAERQTGIPKESIRNWSQHPSMAHLGTRAREEVASEFWTGIQVGLEEVVKGLRSPEAPLRDKATALGVLYDRFALMSGEATSRTESRSLTDDLTDDEKLRLRDWIVSLPATAGDPEPAAG